MNRRDFIKKSAAATSIPLGLSLVNTAQANGSEIKIPALVPRQSGYLSWLEGEEPLASVGTTWGQPWAQGVLNAKQALKLTNQVGQNIPLQTWPTAYWPDGSIKWTAHAVPADVK